MILNVFYDFPKILWLDALVSFNVFQLRSVIFSLSPFISQILRYLLIPIQILMTQVLNDLLSFQINAVTRPKGTYTELSNESNPLLVNHFSLILTSNQILSFWISYKTTSAISLLRPVSNLELFFIDTLFSISFWD